MCVEALLLLLSFGCLSGPITVDPPGSRLDSSDVCYNLLIPFISGCCCWCACVDCVRTCAYVRMRACLSKTDGGGCLCLCVGNESISFTLVSPDKGGRAPCSCICCLSVSFLFLSLSVFSHMLVEFCHHHPLPLSSLWLTSPAIVTL